MIKMLNSERREQRMRNYQGDILWAIMRRFIPKMDWPSVTEMHDTVYEKNAKPKDTRNSEQIFDDLISGLRGKG